MFRTAYTVHVDERHSVTFINSPGNADMILCATQKIVFCDHCIWLYGECATEWAPEWTTVDQRAPGLASTCNHYVVISGAAKPKL